ncbi:MAG: DUF4852 domain-containing protein [Alphaproteobacteria bacterium]
MKKILSVMIMVLALSWPLAASAGEFLEPTLPRMLQAMLRFGALDLDTDVVIDDYAKIAECDLYTTFGGDDFKWHKIRDGLRAKIKEELVTYPTNFYAKGLISLDRYDFNNKIFRLALGQGGIRGVNSFLLVEAPRTVCGTTIKMLPMNYEAVVDAQINIPGFVMDEADASALLARLTQNGNVDRQIMAKFNLRLVYIDRIPIDYSLADKWYDKTSRVSRISDLKIDAKLESVEFFEDKAMTKRIYVYKP